MKWFKIFYSYKYVNTLMFTYLIVYTYSSKLCVCVCVGVIRKVEHKMLSWERSYHID